MTRPTRHAALAAVAVVALVSACGDVETGGPRPTEATVDYTLTWIGDAATDDDGAWQVTNDLGYVIRVDRAYLVTYSAELLLCEEARLGWGRRVRNGLAAVLLPATAYAGHSGDRSEIATAAPTVEAVGPSASTTVEAVAFDPGVYCRVHYLAARADVLTEAMPEEIAMDRITMRIDGEATNTDGSATPFAIETSLNHGIFADLSAPVEVGPDGADVRVARRLDTLFDGIPFDTAGPAAVERALLTNLGDGVSVEVVPH